MKVNKKELKQKFTDSYKFSKLNDNYYGIQRIDFIKLNDGTLLLTEIEDIAPYLDLDCVDEITKSKFILDYKDMVYDYIQIVNNK